MHGYQALAVGGIGLPDVADVIDAKAGDLGAACAAEQPDQRGPVAVGVVLLVRAPVRVACRIEPCPDWMQEDPFEIAARCA